MNLDHMTPSKLRSAIERINDLAERYQSTADFLDRQFDQTGNRETLIRADVWATAARHLSELIANCTDNSH